MFNRARRAEQPADPAEGWLPSLKDAGNGRPAEAEASLLRQIDSALELLMAGSLRRADEAADRGDYEDALAWLQTVDAMTLPAAYEAKRADWMRACSPR